MKWHEDAVLFQCFCFAFFFCRTYTVKDTHTHTHTRQLAGLKGHEDAVLFPCGFSANVAVAAVLAADDDVNFSFKIFVGQCGCVAVLPQ